LIVNPGFVRVEGTEPVRLLSCRKLVEEAQMNIFASHEIVCSMNCNIICVRVVFMNYVCCTSFEVWYRISHFSQGWDGSQRSRDSTS
jgi:hypothetical protein